MVRTADQIQPLVFPRVWFTMYISANARDSWCKCGRPWRLHHRFKTGWRLVAILERNCSALIHIRRFCSFVCYAGEYLGLVGPDGVVPGCEGIERREWSICEGRVRESGILLLHKQEVCGKARRHNHDCSCW